LRAVGGGQRVEYLRDGLHLMTPAVHIAEKLRQFAQRDILRVNCVDVPEAAILHRQIHGKNRHRERRGNQTSQGERRDDHCFV